MKSKHEVVFCIVNAGFAEAVMDSAREAGATGGTVLHASGTANPQAERFFGVTIEPNKDMLMILIDTKIKEQVLHNLYRDVGLKTACQGIAFTLPVNDVVGLTPPRTEEHKDNEKAEQKNEAKDIPKAELVTDIETVATVVEVEEASNSVSESK